MTYNQWQCMADFCINTATNMWIVHILGLLICVTCIACSNEEQVLLYYYGLEESERGLPRCEARQACAALMQRYWRAGALLRLCRCPRRAACPAQDNDSRTITLNNRAHFRFCKPVTTWPECSSTDNSNIAVTIESQTHEMNPDVLEELHHKNIQLTPPQIIFNCRCQDPNYWKLSGEDGNLQHYKCSLLPPCRTGDFCGNVNYDFNALYQSCLCPRNHICVQNGGLDYVNISEILYNGKGKRAYCQKLDDNDYSYEDE